MAASKVTITVPHPSSMLVLNVLAVLGLAGTVVAVGGLTGNWLWGLLLGSVYLVAIALVGYTHLAAAEEKRTADKPTVTGSVTAVPRPA